MRFRGHHVQKKNPRKNDLITIQVLILSIPLLRNTQTKSPSLKSWGIDIATQTMAKQHNDTGAAEQVTFHRQPSLNRWCQFVVPQVSLSVPQIASREEGKRVLMLKCVYK